jgi:allophanate hydrolase
MALNQELTALDARFIEDVRTTPDYRLFALEASEPARPGLLRVGKGEGAPIEAEIWALSHEGFGRFVAGVPSPLSIGTLRFDNGSECKGFLVEAEATRNARDISSLGGWRAYIASKLKSA